MTTERERLANMLRQDAAYLREQIDYRDGRIMPRENGIADRLERAAALLREREPGEAAAWNEWEWINREVWTKNGKHYLCHAVDGDDCVGPFPSQAEAQAALDRLRGHHATPTAGEPSGGELREAKEIHAALVAFEQKAERVSTGRAALTQQEEYIETVIHTLEWVLGKIPKL